MTIDADDVRRLLGSSEPDATLVVLAGRAHVVPAGELRSERYRGALWVTSRAELGDRGDLSDRELEELAANLEAGVGNLGG